MTNSWRTSVAGIAAILIAVGAAATAYLDGNPATVVDIGVTLAAIMAGIGLIAARDNKVSSESAGAK